MWVFPKILLPPNHPFLIGFSLHFGVPLFLETPICILKLYNCGTLPFTGPTYTLNVAYQGPQASSQICLGLKVLVRCTQGFVCLKLTFRSNHPINLIGCDIGGAKELGSDLMNTNSVFNFAIDGVHSLKKRALQKWKSCLLCSVKLDALWERQQRLLLCWSFDRLQCQEGRARTCLGFVATQCTRCFSGSKGNLMIHPTTHEPERNASANIISPASRTDFEEPLPWNKASWGHSERTWLKWKQASLRLSVLAFWSCWIFFSRKAHHLENLTHQERYRVFKRLEKRMSWQLNLFRLWCVVLVTFRWKGKWKQHWNSVQQGLCRTKRPVRKLGVIYFPTNWGAREPQNLPNHRVVIKMNTKHDGL